MNVELLELAAAALSDLLAEVAPDVSGRCRHLGRELGAAVEERHDVGEVSAAEEVSTSASLEGL